MESKKVTVDSIAEINTNNSERFMNGILKTLFQVAISSFKDKYVWKYTNYWEKENADEYDSGVVESELPFIVDQRWIKAKEINVDGMNISESDFPWHGYSLDDFVKLNKKLQSCKDIVCNTHCAKDVEKFRRKSREVYDAYFLEPIWIEKVENGDLCFLSDGRHRIFAATLNDDEVPIWTIEYKKTSEVSKEYFTKRFPYGTWRFLNEL